MVYRSNEHNITNSRQCRHFKLIPWLMLENFVETIIETLLNKFTWYRKILHIFLLLSDITNLWIETLARASPPQLKLSYRNRAPKYFSLRAELSLSFSLLSLQARRSDSLANSPVCKYIATSRGSEKIAGQKTLSISAELRSETHVGSRTGEKLIERRHARERFANSILRVWREGAS